VRGFSYTILDKVIWIYEGRERVPRVVATMDM